MTTAIIKLYPLPNTVWTTAQNDYFFIIGGVGIAFHTVHGGGFIGGIHVRGLRFKLCRASINPFENGANTCVMATRANILFGLVG